MNNLPSQPPGAQAPLIQMRGITKRFSGVLANDSIDLAIRGGEVHALLGENGAGKTTLMNILYGLYAADSGEITIHGERTVIKSPKDAIDHSIAMVHQHFELVPTLTVAENVGLGLKAEREPLLNLDSVMVKIEALSKQYGLSVSPKAIVSGLSVGERQRVEIIKALFREPEALILDEPTSVLTPQEIDGLFQFMRSMASEGKAVVVITHKLPEVMAVSDEVTVLKKGKVVANLRTKDTNPDQLAELMVGREVQLEKGASRGNPLDKAALEVREVSAHNDKGVMALDKVTFTVREGEILGVAGVAGNGQSELAEVLAGLRKTDSGSILVLGTELTNASPRELIEHGVGHIPEDRIGTGLVLDMSIAENLVLELRNDPRFRKRYTVDSQKVHEHASKLVQEYSIATASVDAPARTLSGGNMQKAILAKVLYREPKVLVAVQPTSGLDVGATDFITAKLVEQRKRGVAILLISSDLNEILSLSDRIACIYEGKIMGILPGETADLEEIGLMIGGIKKS
ncbi:MAG TPA: ABC transporter ATP-binding protein [Methanomassiliicoccales archaeon]|nr:ABC transporter ATP-binding protein [Methanomassiliicoccales archaeon]